MIAIVLYTGKDEKGISNTTLRNILWADKSEEKAQNSRRVNIHKLRLLLENLDDVQLENNNIYWSIRIGNKSYCDYIHVYNFLNKINNKETVNWDELSEFPLHLLLEPLLPFVEEDWLDPFKANYSNLIIESMIYLSKQESVLRQDGLLGRIADIIFAHDRVDEYALSLKCQVLHRNGKTGVAKSVYDSFCAEYKNLLGIDYPKSFKDIIQNLV